MRATAARENNGPAVGPKAPAGKAPPAQAKARNSALDEGESQGREDFDGKARSEASFGDMRVLPAQNASGAGPGGSPLPGPLRSKMESAFGADFSDVRVHQGPEAGSLSALAFTQGRDLHFAPGQYNPATPQGQQIIAHELTHVVQQRQGRVALPSSGGVPLNADPSLEAEADALGGRAARGEPVGGQVVDNRAARPASDLAGTAPIQGMNLFSSLFGGRGGASPSPSRRVEEEEEPSGGEIPEAPTISTAPVSHSLGDGSGEPEQPPPRLPERLWNYFSGHHDYQVNTPVYDLQENEDPSEALDRVSTSLRRHAAPGGHGTEVGVDGTQIPVPVLGSVTSTWNPEDRSVTNVTGDDHLLGPGRVERSPVLDEESRSISVSSHGTGDGIFPTMNNVLAPPLWNSVDSAIRYDMNPGLWEEEQRRTEERYEQGNPF